MDTSIIARIKNEYREDFTQRMVDAMENAEEILDKINLMKTCLKSTLQQKVQPLIFYC